MSDIRVFKRYEKKYLLSSRQFKMLMEEIGDTLMPDEYEESLVQNIYFDTEQCQLIRTSLEKPVYKEKLRLRYYNRLAKEDKGYLEIKKKYKGIVYKRRESMYIQDALNFIEAPPESPDTQIGRELAWSVKRYGKLKPSMYLSYKRRAYVYCNDKDVRITFDTGMKYRNYNVSWETIKKDYDMDDLINGNLKLEHNLLAEGQVLMEVKVPCALPLEWVRAFEKYDIYPTSYSKYGTAYMLENEKNILEPVNTCGKDERKC